MIGRLARRWRPNSPALGFDERSARNPCFSTHFETTRAGTDDRALSSHRCSRGFIAYTLCGPVDGVEPAVMRRLA